MAAAVGLSPRGIDFRAIDKRPVMHVFLLLSPEDRPEEHVQAMEVIFRNLKQRVVPCGPCRPAPLTTSGPPGRG